MGGMLKEQDEGQASSSGEADVDKFLPVIGSTPAMQEICGTLARLVGSDLTVAIIGEPGTGKELIARALHQNGKRRAAPFIAVNTASIRRELVESELFGHEKGAFAGAVARKEGCFRQADGGTLFNGLPPDGLYSRIVREVERPLLMVSLMATRGNQSKAAEMLGLNRSTLGKKIRNLNIRVLHGINQDFSGND